MSDLRSLGLQWLLKKDEAKPQDLFASYCEEVANGPMTSYRTISQSGEKQGQNYYTHVLDLITIVHKLRQAGAVALDDREEQLLFTAITIHDLNKIPPYGGHDRRASYTNVVTDRAIRNELHRLDMRRFWPEWEEYVPEIRLLAHLHQHDAAPLEDLDQHEHRYTLDYERLLDLGTLLYAVDNLNLSHTLAERKHKKNFLDALNAVSAHRWRWIAHRLSENRGLLSNLIHNTLTAYLEERHNGQSIPLLYYTEGTAYLLPEREAFPWGEEDYRQVARRVARAIAEKTSQQLQVFVEKDQVGYRITDAAIESGASFADLFSFMYQEVLRKQYPPRPHAGYLQRLQAELQKAADSEHQPIAELARDRLARGDVLVPHNQELLKRGELALAYYNLLSKHFTKTLPSSRQNAIWERIYRLMEVPETLYALYAQVDRYKRANFIASDCTLELETLYQRFLADLETLAGNEKSRVPADTVFTEYLFTILEFAGSTYPRDFSAHLRQYVKQSNKLCCSCSSPLPSMELMAPEVPDGRKVQVFSNRLAGGDSHEPKRNVCPICRAQYILEKATTIPQKQRSQNKQQHEVGGKKEEVALFYLHLFPYAFFTAPYLDAMYSTLKGLRSEDQRCLFVSPGAYLQRWEARFQRQLAEQATGMAAAAKESDQNRSIQEFSLSMSRSVGLVLPGFSETVSNVPTLPIYAPGTNYREQFLFVLVHALMIADFFGCRVVLSGLPVPPVNGEYLTTQKLAFFVDGVPSEMRWLLPANEYRNLETYRVSSAPEGGESYRKRRASWNNERPDEQGYAAFEHIYLRLSALYRIAQELQAADRDALVLQFIAAATGNPLSLYHVADLAIEKAVRAREDQNKAKRSQKAHLPGDPHTLSVQAIPAERRALLLSQRIAPILKTLV